MDNIKPFSGIMYKPSLKIYCFRQSKALWTGNTQQKTIDPYNMKNVHNNKINILRLIIFGEK